MKTYCKTIDITSDEHLERAYEDFAKRGRRNNPKYKDFFGREKKEVIEEARCMIRSRELHLKPINYFKHTEPTNQKTRLIGRECPMQQYLDCVAEMALEDLLLAKVGYHQCASIKGKGQSHALKYIKKWIRSSKSRYFAKLDIKKYYNNIDRDVLFSMLDRDVKNDALLWLVKALIGTHKEGLSIGSRLSQRLANYYLSEAYAMILSAKHERKSRRSGEVIDEKLVTHVLTYMDDWLLVSDSGKHLKMAIRKLERYLRDVLHVELKPWKICLIGKEPIDMVGFVVRKTHTAIRASIFLRARRSLKRARQALFLTPHMAARCIAYWGYFKQAATRKFCRMNGVYGIVEDSKNVMSIMRNVRSNYAKGIFNGAA